MSSSTGHSALPWRLHRMGADVKFDILILPARGSKAIATVTDFGCSEQVNQYEQENKEQKANADLIIRAVNSHDALYEAIDKAQARLDDLPDFLYRNHHDVLAGIVAETLRELRAALTTSDGFEWQDRRAAR